MASSLSRCAAARNSACNGNGGTGGACRCDGLNGGPRSAAAVMGLPRAGSWWGGRGRIAETSWERAGCGKGG